MPVWPSEKKRRLPSLRMIRISGEFGLRNSWRSDFPPRRVLELMAELAEDVDVTAGPPRQVRTCLGA